MTTYYAYGAGGYGDGGYPAGSAQGKETATVNKALVPLPPPVFTGMKLQADVSIGDLVLNNIDSNNVIWVCTDIEGWWTHPDPIVPDVTRGWGDGSFDASGKWGPRQITLTGSILPPDPAYLPAARNTFIQELSLVRTGAWLKTNESPTRAAWVRLSGRPDLKVVNAKGRTDFSVGLRAADPIKYSWNNSDPEGYDIVSIACRNSSTSATGTQTITNVGNTDVTMFMEVIGPLTGPATITNATAAETLTVVLPLRDAATYGVTSYSVTSNVATLTTSTIHDLMTGDTVDVGNVSSALNGLVTVTAVPTTTTFTYDVVSANVATTSVTATVTRPVDVLQLDTYTKEVALNGDTTGARTYVDTLTNWLVLTSGANTIQFVDTGNATSTASLRIYYRSGWIG